MAVGKPLHLLLCALLTPAAAPAEQKPLHLAIGDPDRKDREVAVVLDAIVDTRSGEELTPPELAARLAGVRLLFVGESHTEIEFHRVQLRVLEELRRAGREVLIGLEMYPYTEQAALDGWIAGHYTEDGFVEISGWYDSWSYHWDYYRDIFLFARDHGVPMYAVNTPRDVVRAVREKGFEDLTEEEAAHVPPEVDVTSDEHRRLFRSYFDDEDPLHAQMTDEQWEGMIRAQATWDATMGYNSVKALEKHPNPEAILVVLIGSGHVAYGLGIERQAERWLDGGMASVIPVPVRDGGGDAVDSVRASYADFVWGLPPVTDPLYPSLGVSTREVDGEDLRKVIFVSEDTPGETAGFEVGDVLLTFDGHPIPTREDLAVRMSKKRWGDEATVAVRRGEETVELRVRFRRKDPPPGRGGDSSSPVAEEPVHHRMTVALDPAAHTLRVVDHVRLGDGQREFQLHAALEVEAGNATLVRVAGDEAEIARYRVEGLSPDEELELTYGGRFDFGLGDQKEEYTRGFRDTAGIVGEEGVYLAGSGFWVPAFGDGLVSFELEVEQPDGWHVVSQGGGTSRGDDGRARWDSGGPMEEVFLVGGPLEVYRDAAGAVETLVYLHQRDDALAAKYLDTTAQYLEMYRGLLGPYPYGKFALVENFWETGYGMPSFTLLGPKVLRFPFILHSSYPHEILHNWWGNSVFVDAASGNWCEGLTAYLADHLVKEQRGQAAGYRRETLQKYRDYVHEGQDFPLSEFRSRHSAATEAVGYGKTLIGFHMLRRRLGDAAFVRALQSFYRRQKGERASFDDLRQAFEDASGEDLGRFFDDWVRRSGAADLAVSVDGVRQEDGGFVVAASLEQVQSGEPYAFEVPVVVVTAEGEESGDVFLDGRRTAFEVRTSARPLALTVDPHFDVFRLLDPRETPPSIGQIFGEPEILAVLPADAEEDEQDSYRELMEGWRSDSHAIETRLDREVEELPADRGVWILGRANRFAGRLFAADEGAGFDVGPDGVTVLGEEVPFAGRSLVVIRRHPGNLEKAVGWLAVDPPAAFPGMGRKLPHYGKYSYLGFEGDEPVNTVKGQWPASDSPLSVDLRPAAERGEPLTVAAEQRTALAELPPVFSQKAMLEHVAWLAAPERRGRGTCSDGGSAAAAYLAERFAALGLEPGGADGSYLQRFTVAEGPGGGPCEAANAVGYLPGTRDGWTGQSALLTAHYDHLGTGWPDVHQGDQGKVHPGADDNASGVAVLLELAKNLAAGDRPSRNLVFAAFAAEEAGRLGSRHYVEHPRFPLDEILGVVNLDTVGRLGDGEVAVLGTGTADEWQHIFRGASWVTGVPSRNVPASAEGSDQWSFIEKGVPGVQIFTRAHADYHRPGDTADKVDGAGLVKIATLVKEAVVYLGEREEPFTVTIAAAEPAERAAAPPAQGRRVLFGSVPDFGYPGPGVKLTGVGAGSPAEKAGLAEGDVLLRLDDREIADLRAFSEILKTLTPGQTVTAAVRRGEQELAVEVTLEAR
jgi:uncharacterized iron-regulated protein